MTTTCELIAKTTLGSSASSVTLSTIPATFDDIYLLIAARGDNSGVTDVTLRFNGATADTNHSCRNVRGSGSAVISQSLTRALVGFAPTATETASTFSNIEVYLPNYAGSTNKSFSATGAQETNGATAYIHATAGLWSSTAAITDIEVRAGAGNFVSGSSFFLYGITKA